MNNVLLHSTSFLFIVSLTLPLPLAAKSSTENAFSPRQGATELVVKTVSEAKESICVAAYSFTSQPIADALIAAHDADVELKVVLDKSQRRQKRSLFHYLEESGVPTRINDHYAIMHNKFMVIDDKVLQLGSFNYTKSAEKRNAENVLVIRNDQRVIDNYAAQCKKLWDEAEE